MRGPVNLSGVLQTDIDDDNIHRFWAFGSGSAGDVVVLDLTSTSVAAKGYQAVKVLPHTEADNLEALVVGVAIDAWNDDSNSDGTRDNEPIIRVQVGGVLANVNVDGGIAVGDLLVADFNGTAVGRVKAVEDSVASSFNENGTKLLGNSRVLGVALTVANSNKATVRLLNPLKF
jgi:hypothetical protein